MLEKFIANQEKRVNKKNLIQICSAVLSVVIVLLVTLNTNTITITDQSGMISVMSAGGNTSQILEKAGVSVTAADMVETVLDDSGNIKLINIQRAYTVPVFADGGVKNITANGETVKDLLDRAQITLGENDQVTPSLDTKVQEGTQIDVMRIATNEFTQSEQINYETEYVYTSVLKPGRQIVRTAGANGARVTTFQERYINGVLKQTLQLDSTVQSQAVNSVVAVGKAGAAVSTLNYTDRPIGADGIPTTYTRVMKGAKTTGYSVKPGQGTASGRKPVPGVVAVDPNKIPYGTRMYITSADGKFVYGYAVAGETGTALVDGRVDFDLLYPTYEESCAHGVRYVNVYFLD